MSNFVWAMNEMAKGNKVTREGSNQYLYFNENGEICNQNGRLTMGIGIGSINGQDWSLYREYGYKPTPREIEVAKHLVALGFRWVHNSGEGKVWGQNMKHPYKEGDNYDCIRLDYLNVFGSLPTDKAYNLETMLKGYVIL